MTFNFYFNTKAFVKKTLWFSCLPYILFSVGLLILLGRDGIIVFINALPYILGFTFLLIFVELVFHYRNPSKPVIALEDDRIIINLRWKKGQKIYLYNTINSYYIQGSRIYIRQKGEKMYSSYDISFLTPKAELLSQELEIRTTNKSTR